MLFTGQVNLAIDAKQRLSIPAKFRLLWDPEREGKAWYCVPWPGGVIRLYTQRRFEEMAERGEHLLTPGPDQADLEARLFSLVERLELDQEGRVTIPRLHLDLTGLSGEVVVIGARNRLEVRDRAAWEQSQLEQFRHLPELVERIEARRPKRGEGPVSDASL